MLDQLIESKSHARENAKRGGFLTATFFAALVMLSSGVLWSLFAKDLAMGNDSLELSAMLAPVAENAPPAPLIKEEKSVRPQNNKVSAPTRQFNIARIDEMQPAPTAVSVTPNKYKERPIGEFLVTGKDLDPQGSVSANVGRETVSGVGIGGQNSETGRPEMVEKVPPPPPPIITKKPEDAPRKPPAIVSLGVITGKATNLPKPVYSAAARAVNAGGDVSVQVLIDEKGNVVSAKALGGHPLLKESAERAARTAKFTPTVLSHQPVKVTGIIVYKFLK